MSNMFKVEDVKKMVQASDDLLERLNEVLSENSESDIEELTFEHEGVNYSLVEVWSDTETNDDDDECTEGCKYYNLKSFDDTEISYPCKKNILESFDVCICQGYRSTRFDWYYDEPDVGRVVVETIPEVVIPEHEVVRIK